MGTSHQPENKVEPRDFDQVYEQIKKASKDNMVFNERFFAFIKNPVNRGACQFSGMRLS